MKQRQFDYFMGVAERAARRSSTAHPCASRTACSMRWSRARLWAGDEPARLYAAQGRLYRRGGDRPRNLSLLRSLGINLKQLYGQTEASVYITLQPDDAIDAETVGKPAPDVEIRIAESGEVLYRSPGAFLGYFRDEAATGAPGAPTAG